MARGGGKNSTADEPMARVKSRGGTTVPRDVGPVRVLCLRCREWCDGIYYGSEGLPDMCEACYRKMMEASVASAGAAAAMSQGYIRERRRPRRVYVPTLEDELLVWASVHHRAAFEAFGHKKNDREWEDRILANIFRARAAKEGAAWVVAMAEGVYGDEVLRIAPHVVRAGGYPLAREQGFDEWVVAVQQLCGWQHGERR